MTISKKDIKKWIKTNKDIIEGIYKETKQHPYMARHNKDLILRMEGKIEILTTLLNF